MNNRAAAVSGRRGVFFRTAGRSRLALAALAAAVLAVAGCGHRSPLAPNGALPPTAISTLSGRVYQNVAWADPPLADALIEVTGADGLVKTGFSDDHGFYTIAALPGGVAVTASKPGFETRTTELMLVADTVLNFSLTPECPTLECLTPE